MQFVNSEIPEGLTFDDVYLYLHALKFYQER